MHKLLLLLSCCLIASRGICQSPPAGFPDVPTITETSVGKARIRMPVADLKSVYKGYTFEPRSIALYGRNIKAKKLTALCVKFRGKELFVADILDHKIWNLIALADQYQTANGLHVGSTAYVLKKILPGSKVERCEWKPTCQIVTNEKAESINYWFRNAADLGNYEAVKYLEDNVWRGVLLKTSTATISWIEVTPAPI